MWTSGMVEDKGKLVDGDMKGTRTAGACTRGVWRAQSTGRYKGPVSPGTL